MGKYPRKNTAPLIWVKEAIRFRSNQRMEMGTVFWTPANLEDLSAAAGD